MKSVPRPCDPEGWPGEGRCRRLLTFRAGRRTFGLDVRLLGVLLPLALLSLVTGCATTAQRTTAQSRRFDFEKDTFAFANELVWEYGYDHHDRWTSRRRDPAPDYSHHCFVLARSTAQFFENARFVPGLPVADETAYRRLIRRVVDSSLSHDRREKERIIIPGFPDLHTFSEAHAQLLKDECGGFLQSYFQRGHWRMIFPFSRSHQAETAGSLQGQVAQNHIAVAHVVRFPQLSINHAVVVYDAKSIELGTMFLAYDPNDPSKPLRLSFHRATRTFLLDPTSYFPGGRVDVYQVYHCWNY